MKTSYLVLILMTLVFMFWLYQRDLSSTVEPSTAASPAVRVETPAATAAINPTSSAAVVPSTASGASTAAATNTSAPSVTELQTQLADERLNLEQINSSLTSLRQAQSLRQQQLQNDYPNQIQVTTSTIRGLTEAQQDLRASEVSVYIQSQAQLQEQIAMARLARDTLDPAIDNLESQYELNAQEMQTLQEISLPTVSQKNRLAELQTQLAQQQTQLTQLREQKNNISSSALEQFQILSGTYRQLQNEIRAEQSAVQNELNLRRSQFHELQLAEQQMRMSLIPLEQRILQTERALNFQRQRLQELERQLSAAKAPADASSATEPSSETR